MKAYRELAEYGIIGDLYTCALVGADGSIDWCPFPHVESPSVFAAILDIEKGGHFSIGPAGPHSSTQKYIEDTNVLQTIFRCETGEMMLTDFMPPADSTDGGENLQAAIFREVTCLRGEVEFRVEFRPRFDYARAGADVRRDVSGIIATGKGEHLFLNAVPDTMKAEGGGATGLYGLKKDETAWFVLGYNRNIPADPHACEKRRRETVEFWHRWVHSCDMSRCFFKGKWHDLVVRSSLVLKLLLHRNTGAVCAAPTTSIPEAIGGARNWDYRFNWLRDAFFTVQALASLGYLTDAKAFLGWFVEKFLRYEPEELQTVYGLHGETDTEEELLDHLSGYKGSGPVRIGNAAVHQFQLDIYGELVQGIYEARRYGLEVDHDNWPRVERLVNFVCGNWRRRDHGIWEVRGEPMHFVHSKLMCWVALDRGIKLVEELGIETPLDDWKRERNDIRAAILEQGFSRKLNSFVQAFDTEYIDAATLLIPVMGLLPFDDPRVMGTIEAVKKNLEHRGLIRRYNSDDGLAGEEGTFVLCSFWLAIVLAMSGRLEEAADNFGEIWEHTSPLGLVSEEMDPYTGAQLGNFPQAYSHIGLINSAFYLSKAFEAQEKLVDFAFSKKRGQ